jgi:hypothetical protein
MARVFVLAPDTTFDDLAIALDGVLALTRVVSCTFPSRPEPKEAVWGTEDGAVLAYRYVPDVEVRFLRTVARHALLQETEGVSGLERRVVASGVECPFQPWEAVREELDSPEHQRVERAAAALRIGAIHGDDAAQGLPALMDAVRRGELGLRRAAARELEWLATAKLELTLRELESAEEDLEVRLHLRQAIERCWRR